MKNPNVKMMTSQLAKALAKKRAMQEKKANAGAVDQRGPTRGKKGR